MIGISDQRGKHSLAVARLMGQMAADKGWSEEMCREMFFLGYIHDIGYEFSQEQQEHSYVGGQFLKEQGYRYSREVWYHGIVTEEYSSEELKLLNTADMCIDSSGNHVGAVRRLADIEERYGVSSRQYTEAEKLAQRLGLI